MILGEIRRFLRDDGMIKVSRSIKETGIKVNFAAEKIAEEKGREATLGEIAQYLGISLGEVATALEATREIDSIHRAVNDGDNNPVLVIDKISSQESDEERIINSVALKNGIDSLSHRERQILMLRYYREKTQSEVAKIMGLSQVQISRIEKKLLGILRKKIV